MRVYCLLDTLASKQERMDQFLDMLRILYELSMDTGARTLASHSFAPTVTGSESRRISKVKDYIAHHYTEEIKLDDLAKLAAMAPSAFSRFFKQHTGRAPVDYIIDVRVGAAARMLVDTTTSVSEICYACGFNNLSNFNRTFKSRRGYTPRGFRAVFTKNRVYV